MPDPSADPATDLPSLTAAVRRALDDPGADLVDWTQAPLDYENFGTGSRALRRLSGTARRSGTGEIAPWSMVLKALTLPADDDRATDEADDYAYWRRETLIYGSGLLDDLPAGFRAARCYGVTTSPDADQVWLEDLRDAFPNGWPLERFELAARHLGRFNGAWLRDRRLPDRAWLAGMESVQEFWSANVSTMPGLEALLDPAAWARTTADGGLPRTPEPRSLRAILADRRPVIDALAAQRPTLCHNDAGITNLFAVRTDDGRDTTVAIDWQLAGLAPPGTELAMLVGGSVLFCRAPAGSIDALSEATLRGYVDGLADSGASLDRDDVAFAFAAASVLRLSAIVGAWIHALADQDERDRTASFWGHPAEELAGQWAPLVTFLETQAAIVVQRLGLPVARSGH